MKKFLTLLALLTGVLSNAQTIEIGANAGLCNVRTPFIYSEKLPGFKPSWDRYPFLGVTFSVNMKAWQLGLAMERFTLDGNLKPALDSRLLLNRIFIFKGGYFYTGLTGGYFSLNTIYDSDRDKGYVVGVQGGATIKLWKHLSFNWETSGRYATAWQKNGYHMHYGFLYIPTTVGLKYVF